MLVSGAVPYLILPIPAKTLNRIGMPVRTFGGGFGSTFSKSVKLGACDVSIRSLEVKNKLKCTLKFDVCESGGHDDYDSNYY